MSKTSYRSLWCCYRQLESDPFPVLQAADLDESFLGAEMLEEDDPNCFKWAWEGDHLMCPFQCDTCHFYNIQKQQPGAKVQDNVLLMCIRHAILDSFWSRESATVESNCREAARMHSGGERLGLDMPYPKRLAFPTEDSFGMAIACQTLLHSLDGGRNAATIQFETMQKLRAHYSNFHHTLPGGTGLSTIVEGRGSSTFTGSPTYTIVGSLWCAQCVLWASFLHGWQKRQSKAKCDGRPRSPFA
jgi:hypothetical protein